MELLLLVVVEGPCVFLVGSEEGKDGVAPVPWFPDV